MCVFDFVSALNGLVGWLTKTLIDRSHRFDYFRGSQTVEGECGLCVSTFYTIMYLLFQIV